MKEILGGLLFLSVGVNAILGFVVYSSYMDRVDAKKAISVSQRAITGDVINEQDWREVSDVASAVRDTCTAKTKKDTDAASAAATTATQTAFDTKVKFAGDSAFEAYYVKADGIMTSAKLRAGSTTMPKPADGKGIQVSLRDGSGGSVFLFPEEATLIRSEADKLRGTVVVLVGLGYKIDCANLALSSPNCKWRGQALLADLRY